MKATQKLNDKLEGINMDFGLRAAAADSDLIYKQEQAKTDKLLDALNDTIKSTKFTIFESNKYIHNVKSSKQEHNIYIEMSSRP